MLTWDDEGRPRTWVTTREPEWDDEDRGIIYALEDYEDDLCPGCGHPMSESLHNAGIPDRHYLAAYAVCLGCAAKERAQKVQEAADQNSPNVYRSARWWAVQQQP